MLGNVQICGEKLSTLEVKDIRDCLKSNSLRLLSLRGCKLQDEDFKIVMKGVGRCKTLLHLNLNLGLMNNVHRAQMISTALMKNRSLTTLFLHGSPVGDRGVIELCRGLAQHPNVVTLDLGDCLLTDDAIPYLADLLPPNGAKRGLKDLSLSANPGVSMHGWTQLYVALGSSHVLQTLSLDYNKIGDYGVGCLTVVLASSTSLQLLDLEGCGISVLGAQSLLYLTKNYPVSLQELVLTENEVNDELQAAITSCIEASTVTDSQDTETITSLETTTSNNSVTDSSTDFDLIRNRMLQPGSSYLPMRITPGMVAMATQKADTLETERAQVKSKTPVDNQVQIEVEESLGSDSDRSVTILYPPQPTRHQEANRQQPHQQRGPQQFLYPTNTGQMMDTSHSNMGFNSSNTYDSTSTREAMQAAYRRALETQAMSSSPLGGME